MHKLRLGLPRVRLRAGFGLKASNLFFPLDDFRFEVLLLPVALGPGWLPQ